MINNNHVKMMIDSGASEEIIDEYEYNRLDNVPKLKPCSTKLFEF